MAYLCYNLLYGIGQHSINFGYPLPQCVWQPCDVSVQPDVNDPSRKRNSPRKTERDMGRESSRRRGSAWGRVVEKATLHREATLLSVTRSFFSHGRWFCKMLKKKHKERKIETVASEANWQPSQPAPLLPRDPLLTRRRCHVTNNTPREQPTKGAWESPVTGCQWSKHFSVLQLWFILSTALPASQSQSQSLSPSPSFATLNFVMTAELILLRGDFLPATWAGPFFLCPATLPRLLRGFFFYFPSCCFFCWVDNFATPPVLLLFDKL